MAKNILIVDGSATMRKILTRSIRQASIQNVGCKEDGDGSTGIGAVESRTFDLIVSDVSEAMNHGTEGCLTKPFTPETIQQAIGLT